MGRAKLLFDQVVRPLLALKSASSPSKMKAKAFAVRASLAGQVEAIIFL